MCEPTTLAIASLAVTALSGAASAYGSYQQGQAAQAQANYQAAVARNNQILAEREAQAALVRGEREQEAVRLKAANLKGRQLAALAGAGVVVGSGGANQIVADTAMFSKFDQLTIRSNAEREALGYRTQGMNFAAEADLAKARGQTAKSASMLEAGTTALTTAGSVAGKWYGYKNAGVFDKPKGWRGF